MCIRDSGGLIGKYFLVIVRIFLIGGMVYIFNKWLKEGRTTNYLLIPMAMIFAGAIGNLIDGMFYGLIFDSGTAVSYTHLDVYKRQVLCTFYFIQKNL